MRPFPLKKPIMQLEVNEVALPQNKRSALATTLWACQNFAAGITDLLVHEGEVIRAKTAAGVVPLSRVGNLPNADLVIHAEEIKHFLASYVDNMPTTKSANDYWERHIQPRLDRQESINRSLPIPPAKKGGEPAQLRISLFLHARGRLAMSIRMVTQPAELDSIGLPEPLVDRVKTNPRGLIVITGATGSGKTRTAYSILQYLNHHSQGHILTIEDPIELNIQSAGCVVTQREVGYDTVSFYEGLLAAMRQAPEAVLAGEVRDQDAAQTAILGGESGALMLVTTHGSSIVGTIKRILALSGGSDAFRSVLAGSLIGVVRLDLVPHTDGKQFSLVNETLMGTSTVAQALQAGNWEALEQICARQAPTPDFFPMKPHIDALVKKKQVSLDVAGRLQYAR